MNISVKFVQKPIIGNCKTIGNGHFFAYISHEDKFVMIMLQYH